MKAYSNLILKPDQTKQTQKQEKWGFYMEDGQKKKMKGHVRPQSKHQKINYSHFTGTFKQRPKSVKYGKRDLERIQEITP